LLEQLRYLVELQILQDRKAQLLKGAEETPKRIAEIEREFELFEGGFLSKKAEHDHAKKTHRSIEQSISELETKIARSKTRMTEVKTNKEYQAMLKEIEDVKGEISGHEDQALEVMENIEALGKALKDLEKEVKSRRQKLEEDRKVLEARNEGVKDRLASLEAMEQKVRDKLEADILRRYDFLLQRMGGVAVAAVQSGVCQVCHMNIPPQKFIELQRDEAIFDCPHCHRFVYWPGHEWYTVLEEDLGEVEALQGLG
jgi:predicted  nucleic acid-binding Zn-ribbon protein